MKLVFIHGAPAVGKLSVARELSRLTGLRLFHNHLTVDLVSSAFEFGTPSFVALREQIWLSVFRAAAESDTSLLFTFNPESTVRERFIGNTIEVIESAGGQIYYVELVCEEGELERRIESPSRKEFGKLTSIKQYQQLKVAGAFSFPTLPAGLTLDTTHSSPAETAAEICKYASLEQSGIS